MSKCSFCYPPYELILEFPMDEWKIFVECDGQVLRGFDNDVNNPTMAYVPISYCPMCGRKLRED